MKKHAFLILAHDNPKVLSFLLSQLDDERNDVFILIDKKSSLKEEDFKLDKTNLYFLSRVNVKWGHYSLVDATLRLLEAATNKDSYQYYHLLGGTTLCTKSQDEIHNFYDNTDLEYFHINIEPFKLINNRCKYFYPFIGCKNFRNNRFLKGMSIILGKMQVIVGINRLRHSSLYPLYSGMEWFSITDDFARYLLEQESLIKKTFNHTLASDEVFVQSLAIHSSFKSKIYGYDKNENFIDSSKTYQFWENGKSSYIDTMDKYNLVLVEKKCFYARKFKDDNVECLHDNFNFVERKSKTHPYFPKVSIITCVYNGEKYITKLLESVLNMGYPNIEHIIVDDGSTDSTSQIIRKYMDLYKNKTNSELNIKYIKQKNMGLGMATNTGLQAVTGDYWTWINCDDWYEPNAFFEPVDLLCKKSKLDYVQMNGYNYYSNDQQRKERIDNQQIHFKNKDKLFVDYCKGNFVYLLFICRTSSYKKINPSMSIFPSRYTQDVQLVNQMYGILKGDFVKEPKWNYFVRSDSYFELNKNQLNEEYQLMRDKSIDLLDCKERIKNSLKNVYMDFVYVEKMKEMALKGKKKECKKLFFTIIKCRKRIKLSYLPFLDKKVMLYYLYSILVYFKNGGFKNGL